MDNKQAGPLTPDGTEINPLGKDEIRDGLHNGKRAKTFLLSDGRVATVFEGTGLDVERATQEVGTDSKKYMSAIMGSVALIDGEPANMYIISELGMRDYMKIQSACSDLNF